MIELPLFTCHKQVGASKILEIANAGDGAAILKTEAGAISVGAAYMTKHDPQTGGYYVRYSDGYESFSPAKAFEEGYSLA